MITKSNRRGKWVSMMYYCCFMAVLLLTVQASAQKTTGTKLTSYVNPFIGTEEHGHVFLGANVPTGFVQLGPSNIMQTWDKFNGWDWCSGYNYISKEILGFTHTHLSGTGIGDLNDVLLLPATGKVQLNKMEFNKPETGYGSYFTHEKEICTAGYYKVHLDRYAIDAELTATERVGFHDYHFTKADNPHIVVDLEFGMGWDAVTKCAIKKVNDSTFVGYRFSKGWAADQRLYFAIKLSTPVTGFTVVDSTTGIAGTDVTGKRLKAALLFGNGNAFEVKVKVGLSAVSEANALANIAAEIPHWNFAQTKLLAEKKWNTQLGTIQIEGSKAVKEKFYTALYHSFVHPSIYNDANGQYRGADLQVHQLKNQTNYSVFSLWDTYRGLHPLMTIIQPNRINDYVNSFLNIYRQQGKLPLWHFYSNETNCMIGNPAAPIIVDAFLKGFRNYDVQLAYEAVKHSAMDKTDGLKWVQQLQFIPADSINESVAKGMEYAISDWSIAQMAKALNKEADYQYFSKRAELYKLYFDQQTRFVRGRVSNDQWRTPFNPVFAPYQKNDYTEGNAWQYTWLAPQDVHGLIQLLGGDQPFTQKLDSLFNASSVQVEGTPPDITGMIGQYAHGNEPNHHTPYLYAYAGQPYKTAALIRNITDTFYTAKPNGLCGNDDAGEMSAWYVFSALGFYPVNPAEGKYVFGSPLIDNAVINTGKNVFKIKVVNNNSKNIYIQKMLLNGKPLSKSYLLHSDIVKGGNLVIYMGSVPSTVWGVEPAARP